jgi:TPR repeat protein
MNPSAVQRIVVGLIVVTACRDRSQHREQTDSSGQPARGVHMLAEAKACEAEPPPLDHCLAACELHHSNSCARAGDATRDRAEAQVLYRRACDGGSGLGCEAAGELDKARFYLRVHCEQKHAASCLALGRMFADGRGGPADPGAAATFLHQACQLGERAACAEAGSK